MLGKRELLEKSIKKESLFKDYDLGELAMIGEFIGHNPQFFKLICKTYHNKECNIEYKANIGSSVDITFDYKQDKVTINRDKIEIQYNILTFLQFMFLIDTCFMELIPVGSVVDVDLDYTSTSTRAMFETGNHGTLVFINDRKVSLGTGVNQFIIDYVGTIWPFGSVNTTNPIYLSNAMIKNIVHKGMTNELEQQVSLRLNLDIIDKKKKSIAYLSDEEINKLKNKVDQIKK